MTTHTEADAAAERRYPIQDGPSVPWSYMTPHESTAVKNHGQTLQRLAERGGLGCGEAELIVTDQPLSPKGGEWNWGELKRRWIERAERVNNAWLETAQLRAENARLAADLAAARAERDEARQAAADWRLLAECCALRGVMQFLTAMRHIKEVAPGHDGLRFALAFLAADSHRGDITRSLVDAARRLAAPHLNPPAEGGAK